MGKKADAVQFNSIKSITLLISRGVPPFDIYLVVCWRDISTHLISQNSQFVHHKLFF